MKQRLLNTYIDNLTMNETVEKINSFIKLHKASYVVAVNIDVIMKIEQDALLKEISDNADLTIVDGQPLIWISKIFGNSIKEKVSGSDLVPEICRLAEKNNYRIFILGGKMGIPERAKGNLELQYPGIEIVGTYSPPFGFEKNRDELDRINTIIRESNPDIIIACFGCPKQEKWTYSNYKEFPGATVICAGATVDFLAGEVNRAPRWMSRCGLEWFYRFLQEPKRMFKRYFVDDLGIIPLIIKYKINKT